MLSAVASATQDSRFERLKILKPPALPGDTYLTASPRCVDDAVQNLRGTADHMQVSGDWSRGTKASTNR